MNKKLTNHNQNLNKNLPGTNECNRTLKRSSNKYMKYEFCIKYVELSAINSM